MIERRKIAGLLTFGFLCTGLMMVSCQGNSEGVQTQHVDETTDAPSEPEATESTEEDPKPARLSPTETVSQTIEGTTITIEYGAPSVRERTIWGDLVAYGSVWRTGANEATWISVDHDVVVGGQELPAGKYGLFTIPGETEWEIVINKTWDQWGAYDYSSEDDLFHFMAQPMATSDLVEKMSFEISETGEVTFAWEKIKVSFLIEVPAGGGA